MRKLESDIKRAKRKYERRKREYEEARKRLQELVELKEAERLDEQGVRPNLHNVRYHGAYLHGVQMACNKILDCWFKMENARTLGTKEGRLTLEAVLELALRSKLDADRWIGGGTGIMFEPAEYDKEGKTAKYKASFYVETTVRKKI